jgi:hypothetical protein
MSLADPYLKTTRAKEHLETLRQELKVFSESKPYEFVGEDDVANHRYRISPKIKDTPDKIPLIVGDFFYNLRSSLDQLVWCLAKLTLPYPKNTQFAILEKPNFPRFQRQTSGVPTEAVTIIESLQPYHGRDRAAVKSHLLWRLNNICNIDKHRRIPVHSAGVQFVLSQAAMQSACFYDDEGVVSIPLTLKASLKGQITLDPTNPFKVILGDMTEGIECDFREIELIYDFVANNVIPRFSRFFPI